MCVLCKFTTEVEIDLEKVECIKNKKHSSKIMLDSNIGIMMKYPDISQMKMEGNQTEVGMNIIKKCINMIFTKDETHERDSFTEEEMIVFLESLTKEQFSEVERFFTTMPRVKHEMSYTCEGCGDNVRIIVDGIEDFFA